MGDKLVKWAVFSVGVSLFPVLGSYTIAFLYGEVSWDLMTDRGELFIMGATLSAAGIGDFVYERLLRPRPTPRQTLLWPMGTSPSRASGGNGLGWRTLQLLTIGWCLLDLFGATMAFASMPPNPPFTYQLLVGSLVIYVGGVVSGLLCIVLAER